MDITTLLKERGMTKAELAERMGICNQNVNKTLSNPTESTIRKIADALNVPVWRLFALPEEQATFGASAVACPHCGKPLTIAKG